VLGRPAMLDTAKTKTKEDARAERKRRRNAWLEEDTSPIGLCLGARISSEVYEISENRYMTLLLKGIIVYLITAGGMGSFLTAMEVKFSEPFFHIVIFLTAILCAFLYHSWRSENLGYFIFFIVYASILILFKDYLNSGFYAVINDVTDIASAFFHTEGQQYYNERIANRYLAVTISMTLIGISVNILLNNYILRRARYMVAIFISVTLSMIAFYLKQEPQTIYSLMLLAGIVMTYVLKSGKHYFLSRNDHIFKKKKKELAYGLDYISLRQGMISVLIFVVVVVLTISMIYPRTTYDYSRPDNPKKVAANETIQNIIMLGFGGIFNWYRSNGGLNSGALGGVSQITLDHETDITVEFTPYSNSRIYIKNFIGQTYRARQNYWQQPGDFVLPEANNYKEAQLLKAAFDGKSEYAAKGVMTITNVAGAPLPYQPYYTDEVSHVLGRGNSVTVTYYPWIQSAEGKADYSDISELYLQVPEENEDVIRNFIRDAGIGGSTVGEVVNSLIGYYQDNIPYTIRPGATPRGRDFVNYFLEKNQKGYCAHFASAAVLIFREFGIPARYCEGYAIDYSQIISEGELVDDAVYSDYFEGYSAIGETGLVQIDATDADAHAWVEILTDKGWQVVEVTPAGAVDEDDENANFWESFNDFFGDGDEDNADRDNDENAGFNVAVNDRIIRVAAFAMLGGLFLAGFVLLGYKLRPEMKYRNALKTADESDSLILWYSHLMKKLAKKDAVLREKVNYKEQLEHLAELYKEKNTANPEGKTFIETDRLTRAAEILNRAGFSNRVIDAAEKAEVETLINELLGNRGK